MAQILKRPALLLPAGSPASLDAAINAGADEVYFGSKMFNARMGADNFELADIIDAVTKCHFYGVKVNVTLNTSVHDREYPDLLRLCEFLYRADCDSIICADPGVCAVLRENFPDLKLHASTQCAGHNAAAAKVLKNMGYSRMVVAREASFEDILLMRKEFPEMEYEIFVHGALCVCHSGMCSLSAFMGGRSGNRGDCAQPCRLPAKDGSFPLSLKDNCLAKYMTEIIRSGVDSLKIEGRMKSPEYVYGVGKIYRTLIDEGRDATDEEIVKLERLFSRGGFTDGYFTGNIGSHMLGVRREEDKAQTKEAEITAAFEMKSARRRLPVKITAEFKKGTACRMQMTYGDVSVAVYGSAPEEALTAPLTVDSVKKNLLKLGSTPFEPAEGGVSIVIDDNIMLPVSAINSLRRTACDQLLLKINTVYHPNRGSFEMRAPSSPVTCAPLAPSSKSIAHFTHFHLMPARIYLGGFSHIYLPIEEYLKAPDHVREVVDGVEFPNVVMMREYHELDDMAVRVKLLGMKNVIVNNIGSLNIALKYGFNVHGGIGLNVQSARSANEFIKMGLTDVILSPELKLPAMKAIAELMPGRTGAAVYGKLPAMTVEKCVIRDITMGKKAPEISKCAYCDTNAYSYIVDRHGAKIPVRRTFTHRNILYNSVPVYMADKLSTVTGGVIGDLHYFFCDETATEAFEVIEKYRNGDAPAGDVRRL